MAQNEAEVPSAPVVTPIAHSCPLTTCVVSDEALGEDPETFSETIDAAINEPQLMHYPIDTCIVGKGEFGGMGDVFGVVAGTQLVGICCEGCVADFKAQPQRYLSKIAQASK